MYGEPILQKIKPPLIDKEDLLADINFNLGVAFSAYRTFRSGNKVLANDLFSKSCFYATRDFIYFLTNKLCITYNEIYEISKTIKMPAEYKELLDVAHYLRNNPNKASEPQIYYKNLSYINKFILKKIA